MDATSMQLDHVYEVHDLDRLCYPKQPLDVDNVGALIRDINTSGYVVYENRKLVAYAIYDIVEGDVSILRLGVHPEFRGRGLAWRLMNRIKGKIHVNKPRLFARVPDICVDGHNFLARQGFIAKRIIHTKYGDSYEFIFRAEWKEESVDVALLTHSVDTTEVDL
jgi:ribosomal protein S18 acetylase RimI-like enzyme